MYQNSSCITFPGVASHISNETPCSCCKNQGIRVKKNFTTYMKHDKCKGKTTHLNSLEDN